MAGRISLSMMSLLFLRHCEEGSDEAIQLSLRGEMDCFASLAITVVRLGQVQSRDHEVDGLDADEGNDDAAEAIDQQVTAQQRACADCAVRHALQRQRNQ